MLDGATKWQQAKYITLPLMKTILITMFILNVGKIFYSDLWSVLAGNPGRAQLPAQRGVHLRYFHLFCAARFHAHRPYRRGVPVPVRVLLRYHSAGQLHRVQD